MSRPREPEAAGTPAPGAQPCGGPSASSLRTYAKMVGVYERWCIANAIDPWPATETVALRFMHLHRQALGWGHSYCATMRSAIGRENRNRGHTSVAGPASAAWLRAVAASETPDRRPPAKPLTLPTLEAIAQPLAAPNEAIPVLRARFAIAAAAELQVSLAELCAIERAAVVRTDRGWVVPTAAGPAELVDDASDPLCAAAVLGRLLATDDAARRVLRYPPSVFAEALKRCATRAGLADRWDTEPWPGAPLDEQTRRWLIAWCDPKMLVVERTVAWALVATAFGARNDELARMRIESTLPVSAAGTGAVTAWRTRIGRSKGDQAAKRPCRTIAHGPLPGQTDKGHPVTCPACAYERWTGILARTVGHTRGLVFPAFDGWSVGGSLRSEVATASLRNVIAGLGKDPTGFSSRSARVGTVVNARAGGATLDEIAELVGWRGLDVLVRYLRYIDPWADQYHLPL